jgi:serine/threonine protein kinase
LLTGNRSYTDPDYVGLLITPVAECDLKTFLARRPVQQFFVLQNAFGCLTAALQYLHEHRCRHKDIKPANILIHNESVVLTDFGISRDWLTDENGTTIGNSGSYTPAYAAPEVVDWEARNEAADVWSLGCVFLEMLVRIIYICTGSSINLS